MLDDSAMEKKNPGRSSASCKGNTSDSKVKPDAPPKQQGRSSWKRGNGCQQDPPRKPAPQRNRCAHDKRPMPRGGAFRSEDYRSEVAKSLQDPCVDTVKKGSKKLNLNHLLNFTLAPRENADHHHYRPHYNGRGGHRPRHRLPKYNKEQFLQANCQFVVRDGGSYGQHCLDPDLLVDWELVEEVRNGSYEGATCPICLYPPVAAKMTRCGHVYCWPCMLHYLSLSDHSWRRCPICYEAIHRADLKSVLTEARTLYRPGDRITMCLMRREKGGTLPVPQPLWKKGILEPLTLSDDQSMICYQKLLTANTEQVEAILNREERQLQQQLDEEGDTPEACFVQAALQALSERRQALHGKDVVCSLADTLAAISPDDECLGALASVQACETQLDQEENLTADVRRTDDQGSRQRCMSNGDDDLVPEETVITAEDLELGELECSQQGHPMAGQDPRDSYYFYQAADGQAIFLHALNVKMLVRDYRSLEQSPPVLTAEIVEIESASIDENLRQRLRYLRHLPLTCEIQVVELKLEPPLVAAETLQHFATDIDKRRRMRDKRAREEKKRDRYLAQEELKRQGRYPAARFNLSSLRHFPSCEGPPSEPVAATSPTVQHAGTPTSCPSGLDTEGRHSVGSSLSSTMDDELVDGHSPKVSFAQMLQNKDALDVRTGLAWTRKDVKLSKSLNSTSSGHPDSECEDYVPVPSFHRSFSLALQDAFDNLAKANTAADEAKCGKKKNKNKTVLFSTYMNRSK